jgi:hypothetical protein
MSIIYILIAGFISNTIVACVWLNGIYRNPEASKFTITAVMISCGTSELAMIACIVKLFAGEV